LALLRDIPTGERISAGCSSIGARERTRGTGRTEDRNDRRLLFTLHGRDGARRYALIHTGGKNWLAHLTKDQPAG
jgi:hypothetical protein